MKTLFDDFSTKASKLITNEYSTSFSMGILLFNKSIRPAIYAIYGFVRLADEVVDSFEDYDQQALFQRFKADYNMALKEQISLNPILNSFIKYVHKYNLIRYVQCFLESMEADLEKSNYTTKEEFDQYVYGSADVVGLMCLRVFVEGDEARFGQLKNYALKLGSAFQKVNFLRDISHDMHTLGRSYFPGVDLSTLTDQDMDAIITEIKDDFKEALIGIKRLPPNCRLGVYVAYRFYRNLLAKLEKTRPQDIMKKRTRVSNFEKLILLNKSVIRHHLNVL